MYAFATPSGFYERVRGDWCSAFQSWDAKWQKSFYTLFFLFCFCFLFAFSACKKSLDKPTSKTDFIPVNSLIFGLDMNRQFFVMNHKCSKPAVVGVCANNCFTAARWRWSQHELLKQPLLFVSNTYGLQLRPVLVESKIASTHFLFSLRSPSTTLLFHQKK